MRQRVLIPTGILLAALGVTGWFAGLAAAGQTPAAKPFKVPVSTYTPAKTPWGDPDIQGVWDNHSTVPLERPTRLGDKKTYTDEELRNMRGFRAGSAGRTNTASSVDQLDRVRAYDDFWGQAEGVKDNRTAQIEDPANGRIPALTPAAKAAQEAYLATHPSTDEGSGSDVTHWDGFDTRTRCIAIQVPAGVMSYNSASYVMQSPGWVMIALERLNTRMIPLDGRPHSGIRSWQGDSIGHWEGNTLVVETTNFTDEARGATFQYATKNMTLVERFTRTSDRTIDYQFTVSDPDTWTRPWTVKMPWNRIDGLIYEYACHEGNLGLEHMLSAARAAETKSK